ncbi:MAG: hypothetical protein L3J03_08345, partial [Desulfobacterales bacterium]|nr:hypothetical protein [Desulfobacterales bacterium]
YGNLMPVSVHQWLRFVHLGLRSILVLFEQAKMGEDEVLVNAYGFTLPGIRVKQVVELINGHTPAPRFWIPKKEGFSQ